MVNLVKICFIGDFPLPNNSPNAGPENVLYNLVKNMSLNQKIDITILTIHSTVKDSFVHEYFPKVQVHYFARLNLLPRIFGDSVIVRKFIESNTFDLIHAHYPTALTKIIDMEVPIVLTLHGMFHIEKKFARKSLSHILYSDYNMLILKKILPKLDGFVAISPYVIDVLQELNLYDEMNSIFQINNPIDDVFFSNTINEQDNNLIYYPARIIERKNQLAAIEAIKIVKEKIPDVKLIMTGSSDKIYLKKVNEAIVKNNITANVEYLGSVSREKIINLYGKTSIVYLLSHQETQPMSIIESMASGTAVIASNINSNRYVVENGVTGYIVKNNDYEKIAKYTIELLEKSNQRFKFGENAKETAIKKYHPDVVVKQTLEMYETVVNKL